MKSCGVDILGMKKVKLLICFVFVVGALASFLSFSQNVSAEGLRGEITGQLNMAGKQTGLGATDPRETAARIINYALGLLGTLFLVLIVYAGYLWMTAGGEEQQIEKAQGYLKNGIIGLVIVLAAVGITLFVTKYLIRATGNQFYENPTIFLQGGGSQ